MRPCALILYANGTNRDQDLADAFEQAGAKAVVMPLTQLSQSKFNWNDYQILALPGGFAYADTLGAGKLLALALTQQFGELLQHFIEKSKPIIGICNGFQVLVKAGLLPELKQGQPTATLSHNKQKQFECRWVTLTPHSKRCLWTAYLNEPLDCPIAHGEGQLIFADSAHYEQLAAQDQIAFRYAYPNGQAAQGHYPINPNGTLDDIAGICNPAGNILGMMPHPENHIFPWQYARRTAGLKGRLGLSLFQQGVRYVNN